MVSWAKEGLAVSLGIKDALWMESEKIQVWFVSFITSPQSLLKLLIYKPKTIAIKKSKLLLLTISCHRRQKSPFAGAAHSAAWPAFAMPSFNIIQLKFHSKALFSRS